MSSPFERTTPPHCSRNGYRVQGYASRQAALNAFDTRLPDLVIIDINLGEEIEGGFELCRELRARSRLP